MEKALHQPSLVSFRPWRQHCSWPLDVGANSEHTSPRHSHGPTTVVDRGLWGDTGTFRHLRARWGFSRNLFQQGCAHDFWGHKRLCRHRLPPGCFRPLRGRPGACIILYPTHTSQSRLEVRFIGYTSLLEDPVYLTPVWQPFNAHLVLPAGITANNIHRGNLHPRSKVLNHLIRVSGDRKLR
jgi:hypothetical protein